MLLKSSGVQTELLRLGKPPHPDIVGILAGKIKYTPFSNLSAAKILTKRHVCSQQQSLGGFSTARGCG